MMQTVPSYEQLGLFYLGKERNEKQTQAETSPLLFRSKHLTTHGVIIGMTGSGKTGLGIGLIEEAIMDGLPSIVIDPKGDMANLLLTFPELQPADFEPWVDPAEASRKSLSTFELAEQTATTWEKGLESWGQTKERLRTFQNKSAITVYTPGSTSGVPISILSSFAAPGPGVVAEPDALNALVASSVTSLLALLNITGDPLTSREHILIASILIHHWRKQEDLTIEQLIGAIVNPPFDKVGVFGLAQFYPQNERMQLAMAINNLIASPAFGAWLQGEPLNIQNLLYSSDGQPQTAIFSISHLTEGERMFFVSLLLNKLIAWMRKQQGTSSLRALLYMDEIFGYFPPQSNPPSKKPMLLLLKQARAFGVGVVLATQNPVDLDYKGLSNIGSWFVGRLQTSQDQNKVVDGIVGASNGTLDRAAVKNQLSDMPGRHFLLTSAHLDTPVLFETRWVMSYLKGPISLEDIAKLMQDRPKVLARAAPEQPSSMSQADEILEQPPMLNEAIEQLYYLAPIPTERIIFEPWLAARASVRFYNSRRNIDEVREYQLRLYLDNSFSSPHWTEAEPTELFDKAQPGPAPAGSRFYCLPPVINELSSMRNLEKDFCDFLYQNERLELLRAPSIKLESLPSENEAEFRVRLAECMRMRKEEAAEKLLKQFQIKQERLQAKLEAARLKIEKEKQDVSAKTTDTLISFGTAVLGAFFGRKTLSASTMSRTASGIKKASQLSREKADVRLAEDLEAELEAELRELAQQQNEELQRLAEEFDTAQVLVETFAIKPRRSDIFNVKLSLLWEMVPSRYHLT